jgi:hypothetical protein
VAVGDPVLVTLCSVFPSLCVPSASAGNLATSPVPGTVSQLAIPTVASSAVPPHVGQSVPSPPPQTSTGPHCHSQHQAAQSLCVFPVSPQEILLPTRFRALSYRQPKPTTTTDIPTTQHPATPHTPNLAAICICSSTEWRLTSVPAVYLAEAVG